jgi:hypothetical protein
LVIHTSGLVPLMTRPACSTQQPRLRMMCIYGLHAFPVADHLQAAILLAAYGTVPVGLVWRSLWKQKALQVTRPKQQKQASLLKQAFLLE